MQEIPDPVRTQALLCSSGLEALFSFPVADKVRLYRAARGEYILREGAAGDGRLYYLVSGRAKLFCSLLNGRTSLLDFFTAPCFIGEIELLGLRSETMGVRALATCELLALPADELPAQLLNDPVFLRALCLQLAGKERRKTLALNQSHGYPLANRLAAFILSAASGGRYAEKNVDAAEYLGVSYRHLQQVLGEFIARGWLVREARGCRIADEEALRALADEMAEYCR